MTWTRPPRVAGDASPRLFHYAAKRNATVTVALCTAEWSTELSEAKASCTPAARCPACEAIRSALHATPAAKARVTLRQTLRRNAERRAREPYQKSKED